MSEIERYASDFERRADAIEARNIPEAEGLAEQIRGCAALVREVGEDFRRAFGEDY